jgi:cation-transporting ATPase G
VLRTRRRTSGAGAEPTALWQIPEVRRSALAGAFLIASLIANGRVADGFFLGALAVSGWTFIPESLRALPHGRLGVGTLMTIAAIGAVALGELGEAASLAFLFSISEAIEGYAMAHSRRPAHAAHVGAQTRDGAADAHDRRHRPR